MRKVPHFTLLLLVLAHFARGGVVDLTTLENYANQPVPNYLIVNKDNTTPGNAITDKGATLGRILFYDKRLSRNDTVACASCHKQAQAFGDTATASVGVTGTTGRHSMRLVNTRFAVERRFFWNERAATLEAQTTQPVRDHVEMGFSGASGDPAFATLLTKLAAIEEYRVLFAMTFGDPAITETRVQNALAQFVRSIQSFDSRFDIGRAQVAAGNLPFPNFTPAENAGKQDFLQPRAQGGAGCAGCHQPPEFDIDPASRNNGVIAAIGGGTDLTNTRSPSLRDLVGPGGQSNGPFMHDGSRAALIDVIEHYNLIPGNNPNLDVRLGGAAGVPQSLNLTQGRKNNLVAFLRTLTGSAVYTDPKWSNPFDAQGQISLIVLPTAGITIQNHGDGTATIACQAVAGLPYILRSSPDLQTWTPIATVTADANGLVQQTVTVGGTLYFHYAYQPPAASVFAAPPPPAPVVSVDSTTSSVAAAQSPAKAARLAAVRRKMARIRR